MRFKWVGRRSGKLLRLLRFVWTRGTVGDGVGYSCKLSLALYPRLLGFRREYLSWFVYFLGLRFHFVKSYGGQFVD